MKEFQSFHSEKTEKKGNRGLFHFFFFDWMEIEVLPNKLHSQISETHSLSFADARRSSSDVLFPDDNTQTKTTIYNEVANELRGLNISTEQNNTPTRKPSSASVESFENNFGASQILPKLWLGNLYDASNIVELKSRNITHILTLTNKIATPKFLHVRRLIQTYLNFRNLNI